MSIYCRRRAAFLSYMAAYQLFSFALFLHYCPKKLYHKVS